MSLRLVAPVILDVLDPLLLQLALMDLRAPPVPDDLGVRSALGPARSEHAAAWFHVDPDPGVALTNPVVFLLVLNYPELEELVLARLIVLVGVAPVRRGLVHLAERHLIPGLLDLHLLVGLLELDFPLGLNVLGPLCLVLFALVFT